MQTMSTSSLPWTDETHRRHSRSSLLRSFLSRSRHITPLVAYVTRGGNANRRVNNTTALCFASSTNFVEAVSLLLDMNGIDINLPDSTGQTPLHLAADRGHVASLKLLLGRGADVNARCSDGKTPLALAVLRGNDECVKLLIDAGASVNSALLPVKYHGVSSTLLSIALFLQRNFLLARRLLHAGAMPYPLTPPLDYILLEDPHCSESMVDCMTAAGFNIHCPGWISRMVHQLPSELTQRQRNLLELLTEARCQPASLQQLCRVAIRTQLGKCEISATTAAGHGRFRDCIAKLPLPKILQCYVALERECFPQENVS